MPLLSLSARSYRQNSRSRQWLLLLFLSMKPEALHAAILESIFQWRLDKDADKPTKTRHSRIIHNEWRVLLNCYVEIKLLTIFVSGSVFIDRQTDRQIDRRYNVKKRTSIITLNEKGNRNENGNGNYFDFYCILSGCNPHTSLLQNGL